MAIRGFSDSSETIQIFPILIEPTDQAYPEVVMVPVLTFFPLCILPRIRKASLVSVLALIKGVLDGSIGQDDVMITTMIPLKVPDKVSEKGLRIADRSASRWRDRRRMMNDHPKDLLRRVLLRNPRQTRHGRTHIPDTQEGRLSWQECPVFSG